MASASGAGSRNPHHTKPWHRTTRMTLIAGVLCAFFALVAVSCGGNDNGAGGSKTLRGAIVAIDAPVDPDTYYGSGLLDVTRSTYEGLVRYKKDSTELEGELATSWQVSSDGKTYTFKLRPKVKYDDGTPFDSAAAKASFERRIALQSGPTYMVQEIDTMETPDPQTFVIHLKKPVAPFLSYLASPWGPVMTNPKAIKEHQKNPKEYASKWLATHSAGTGPYVLSQVVPDSKMVMTENKNYWGKKPHFTTINLAVIPDISNQRLQLEGGSLDFIRRGLSTRDVESLDNGSCCDVHSFPKLQKDLIWVNPESPVFQDPKVRAALQTGFDKSELTKAVHVSTATPSTTFYPTSMLPDDSAPDDPEYNPDSLKEALAPYAGKKVRVGSVESDQKTQQMADLVLTKLQAAGLSPTIQKISDAQEFAMMTKPKARPDIFAAGTLGPDSVDPDTWAQVFFTAKAPANFLQCAVKPADDAVYQALNSPNPDQAMQLEIKGAEEYRDSGCWVAIADVPDILVARKGITGFDHQLTGLLSLGALTEN